MSEYNVQVRAKRHFRLAAVRRRKSCFSPVQRDRENLTSPPGAGENLNLAARHPKPNRGVTVVTVKIFARAACGRRAGGATCAQGRKKYLFTGRGFDGLQRQDVNTISGFTDFTPLPPPLPQDRETRTRESKRGREAKIWC